MVFTLEALPARYGDALLLHYGQAEAPQLVVIDGGPPRVYREHLGPRLAALRQSRSPNGALRIRMVMVSHIDEDHIAGLVELTNRLAQTPPTRTPPYDILTLWHNSFDDIVGGSEESERVFGTVGESVRSAEAGGAPPEWLARLRPPAALVVASVNQGRKLRDNARKLDILTNEGFTGLVGAPESGRKEVPLGDGLTFTVVGPGERRIADLQKEWDREIRRLHLEEDGGMAKAAAFVDNSVYNLSSIVVLASAGGRTILLTGDARGDDIIRDLESAGLKQPGEPFHVDVLKLPHHGSSRNVAPVFFEQVTANHYVVSSNGEKFSNPDIPTLQWLSDSRADAPYRLYLTYPLDQFDPAFDRAGFEALLASERHQGRPHEVIFPNEGAPSVRWVVG